VGNAKRGFRGRLIWRKLSCRQYRRVRNTARRGGQTKGEPQLRKKGVSMHGGFSKAKEIEVGLSRGWKEGVVFVVWWFLFGGVWGFVGGCGGVWVLSK